MPSGRDLWRWPPAAVFLIVVVGFLVTSAVRITIRERAIARERRALEERVAILEAEKSRLAEAIRALGDPAAVERLAKERLNLKNTGEEVVVVVPDGRTVAAPPASGSWLEQILGPWLGALIRVFRH